MQRSRAVWIGAMGVVALGAVAPRPASAQISEWSVVEVTPGEPTAKVKDPPPDIRVRVVGEPAPRDDEKDRFKLELDPNDNPRRLRGVAPTKIIPFHKSNESVAIAVLVEGHQYYFGNDKYTEGGRMTLANGDIVLVPTATGVYDVILNALDAPAGAAGDTPTTISKASENPASRGSLIVYSVGADVRYPMGPLNQLLGDKLGSQDLQKGKTSRDLAEGLRTALAQLRGVATTRKVLFVISDGFDVAGPDEFRALRNQFNNEKIDIFAFHFEAASKYIPTSDADTAKNKAVMRTLGDGSGGYFSVTTSAALATKIGQAVTAINSRYYLVFPGQLTDTRSRAKSGFDWDGKEHEVRLIRDDEPINERNQVVLFSPVWGQPKPASNLLMWLGIGGGAVVLIGGVTLLATRKKAPAPPPPVVMAPPVQAPPPPTLQPVAAGANKTMAINLSSGDGVPVVGWIVPINGPQQFQTFKLFAGVTKVGNAHGAHIVINDAFMSGEHAHVVMSPTGFTLIDNGSTNGTLVNERRVQRHDLIDNDVIKFGKTDCKFKTINTDT